MRKTKCYENYPCWIIAISNLLSIMIYISGAYIIYHLGIVWLVCYLIYIIWLEMRLMMGSCVNCYYYGKFCAFGKGKICALLFKKGKSDAFLKKNITWKDIIPDFLVSIIPLIAGILLLIFDFNWMILSSIVILFILTSAGNGFVRNSLACRFCRQRESGCPAEKLFNKKK